MARFLSQTGDCGEPGPFGPGSQRLNFLKIGDVMQRPARFHQPASLLELKPWGRQFMLSLCLGLSLCLLGGCSLPSLGGGENRNVAVDSRSAASTIPKQITVQDLAQRIEAGDESYWLIDVRTPEEAAIARIPTSTNIPIAQIVDGTAVERILAEQGDRQIILHCYSGVRSRRAQKRLAEVGIATTDLKGGIKAWRKKIDPSLPKKLLP